MVTDGADLGRLVTESRHPGREDLDRRSTAELVALMNAEDATVAAAVAAAGPAIARTVDAVADRIRRGGRLFYAGAGSAGRVGQMDAAEIVPTFGVEPGVVIGLIAGGAAAGTTAIENVEDDEESGAEALRAAGLTATDAVIGIAASGRTPYTVGAVRYARSVGAFTGAVVCNVDTPLAAAAEVGIEVIVGAEFISGSTRLKAGTAQKLVLNMISTLAMVRLGKTYGDLMVDVRATNEKLRHRARRIVAAAAGTDEATAAAALDAAGGHTRTAIVMVLTGLPAERAHELVNAHESLRAAVEAAED
ncbi:MAG TPA: N-acetylmuramic acid 6-phosphate etherase [Mycobacteriales bacterium]|nr:N-acetylmuramic acid 6-phosphate etherase [Mycobacteriales bacterium]